MRFHLDGRTRAGILEGRVRAVLRAGNGQEITSGMVVPVMPASGPAVFRVRVIDADWITLAEALPDGDVKRARDLGARTSLDAQRAWLTVNDRRLRQLDPDQRDDIDDIEWQTAWVRHQDRHVWLLTVAVEPAADLPRFLGRGHADRTALLDQFGTPKRVADGGDSARGYTTLPGNAVDEAECVSDIDLARFRVAADAREIVLLEDRIQQVKSQLGDLATDADTRDLRVIEQRLEQIRRRHLQARNAV